jgi:hypothetical protein
MKNYILMLALLAGCNTLPVAGSKTIEVKVPVPVPCRISPVDKPQSPLGSLKREDDIHTKTKAILAQIELDKAYQVELEAAQKGCQ